jgi:hypothetical protein
VEAVSALVAGVLSALRALVAPDVCPGGWAWATSALGVGVGLLPTSGAVAVAVLRRRIGSAYGVVESVVLIGLGLLTAGLLPLLALTATGRVFTAAAGGTAVPGLAPGAVGDLADAVCVVGPQGAYLGVGTVREAFDPGDPLRFGPAIVLLLVTPLVTAMFVAAQARLALRRGPSWPSRFFWLPVLAVAVLSADAPAGSSGHLWFGMVTGAVLGTVVVALVPPPSREVVRRSRAGARPGPRRSDPGSTAGPDAEQAHDASSPAGRDRDVGPVPAQRPPVAPLPAARPGGTPGPARFRLLRRLGSGGFGRVWLAHDATLGHAVALKAAHAPDAETEERIRREARALAAVRHPNCVRVHDLVHARSDPGLRELDGLVIVMEYVRGAPLGELVRSSGTLDDIAAARVWSSVASALDAAHRRGVLHRDVKPGNIVVDPVGLAHLIDFGIARRTGDATLTMVGFVLGTPDYLAPEVAAGGSATPASDAWQLAATVCFALSGHPPRGTHPDAVSGLRAAAAGAPLTHVPAGTAHRALLLACLDTDPARRPSLAAVQRALEDWLHQRGARADGAVTAGRTGR